MQNPLSKKTTQGKKKNPPIFKTSIYILGLVMLGFRRPREASHPVMGRWQRT